MDYAGTAAGHALRPEDLDGGMRMSEIDEIKAQYRMDLTALEQKSQAEYDRVVLWLSGGAMAVSFSFVGRLIGDSPLHMVWALMVAWTLWVLSLACVLWSHFFSIQALRKAAEQADVDTLDSETAGGAWDMLLRWLNPAGGVAFVVGAIFAGLFMVSNLGGNSMQDRDSDRPSSQTETSSELSRPADPGRVEERGHRPPLPPPQLTTPKGAVTSKTSKTGK